MADVFVGDSPKPTTDDDEQYEKSLAMQQLPSEPDLASTTEKEAEIPL